MEQIPSYSKRQMGQMYEQKAEAYLLKQGLKLVHRNFLCKTGEIDLIMWDQHTLVFVEVRFRKSAEFGGGEASISRTKQRHLILSAHYYLQRYYQNRPPMCRFDVVAISGENINWIKNAFYA